MIFSANKTLATDGNCYRKCAGNRLCSMNEVTYLANYMMQKKLRILARNNKHLTGQHNPYTMEHEK